MTTRTAIVVALLTLFATVTVARAQEVDPPGVPTIVVRMATEATRPEQATLVPPTETYVPTSVGTSGPTSAPAVATTPAPVPPVDLDRPILRVIRTHADPSPVAPGQAFDLRIEVENVGRRDAEHVQLVLGGGVFLPLDRGAVLYKEEIDRGETRPFETRLRVDSAAQSGVFALSLGLRWEDGAGGVYSDQSSLGIQVVSTTHTRPVLSVTASQLPARCVPGAPFGVSLTLTNGGGAEARNVAIVPAAGPLTLSGGDSTPLTIPAGGSGTVTLSMMATESATPGANAQTLEIRYDDPDGQRYTDTTAIGISVSGDAALGPMPMVAGYRVTGSDAPAPARRGALDSALHPGEVFELEIDVQNVGAHDASSTRLALGGGASAAGTGTAGASAGSASLGVFAPLDTSNVRFLGRLAAGATRTVRQRMVVDGAAKPGVYVLQVQFAFADPDGVAGTSSEVISLLVSRRLGLEINPIAVVTTTVVGRDVPFGIEIVNAGDAKVSVGNTEVLGENGVEVTDGTVFVGPIDAGSVYPVDATLVARQAGKAVVRVVVHYTDDFGQPRTMERSFDLVAEDEPAPPPDTAARREEAGGSLPLRIVRGLFGLGASAPRSSASAATRGEPLIIRGSSTRIESDAVRAEPAPAVRTEP